MHSGSELVTTVESPNQKNVQWVGPNYIGYSSYHPYQIAHSDFEIFAYAQSKA